MSLIKEKIKVNSYFRLMKNWDNETKKDMIIQLTESINDEHEEKYDFSSCFGAWDDERTADEIIKEIRCDRVNNRDTEEF